MVKNIDEYKKNGWTKEQIAKGYEIFACYGASSVVDGALIIEAIGDVNKFKSDWEACRQAEKDGTKFINDIEGLEKGCYIDTPENRKLCLEYIEKYPEFRVENLIRNTENESEYWKIYKEYFGQQ